LAASLNIVEKRSQFVCCDPGSLAAVQLVDPRLYFLSKLRLAALQLAENLQACGDNVVLGTIFPSRKLLLHELLEVGWNGANHD
jgi:hypothetical protein